MKLPRWIRHPVCALQALRAPDTSPPTAGALRRHAEAITAGSATYTDPVSGKQVMTEAHLRATLDACCGLACRHCPWPEG